jgi:hypothetical protein
MERKGMVSEDWIYTGAAESLVPKVFVCVEEK